MNLDSKASRSLLAAELEALRRLHPSSRHPRRLGRLPSHPLPRDHGVLACPCDIAPTTLRSAPGPKAAYARNWLRELRSKRRNVLV